MDLHFSGQNIISFLLAAIPALISLSLAIFIFARLPVRLLTNLFAADILFTMLWQVGSALTRISSDAYTATFFDSLFEPFGFLCSPLILHFALLFALKDERKRYFNLLYVCYFITFMFALAYPVFNSPSHFAYDSFWGWVNTRPKTVFGTVSGLFLQAQYILAIVILVNGFLKTRIGTPYFYQLLIITLSLILIIAQAVATEGVLPQVYHIYFPVTSSLIAVYIIGVFIALTRFRLFRGFDVIDKRDLLASISDIVIVVTPDLKVAYVNDSGLGNIQYSSVEIEGKLITSILDIEDTYEDNFLLTVISPILSGNRVNNIKCFLKSKHGDKTPVLLTSDVFKSKKSDGILLVCRNISDLEKAQTEVRRHSAYLEQLFEASPFAIVNLDTTGTILTTNNAFEKIFHYPPSEVKGKKLADLIMSDSDKDGVTRAFEKVMAGEVISFESLRETKEGGSADVFALGYPIILDNKVAGAYIIYIDISEQKSYEKEIVAKNEELVKINRELDKFFYSASHDIRAPLTTILGLVNIAEMDVRDKKSLEYFNMIRTSVMKLDAFTLDLIRFSNNIRTEVVSSHFNVNDLITDVVNDFRNRDEIKGIRFDIQDTKPLHFSTDRQRLHDILYQVILNATTYHDEENNDRHVKINATVKSSSELEIEVQDNGLGIEEQHLNKIFEMFSKLSDKSHGAGLGLYIVNEIVVKLNGKIDVESRIGEGSKFLVKLPAL
jgi:PAS domain S-box-containing protein